MADVQALLPTLPPFSPSPVMELPEPAATGASGQATPASPTDGEPTTSAAEPLAEAQPSGSVEEATTDTERPASPQVDGAAAIPLDPDVLPVSVVEDEESSGNVNSRRFWRNVSEIV